MATKKIEKVEEIQEPEMPESEEKQAFRLLIEKYKEQNPVKYEQKKETLEKKLNLMK
jgi:hypothetical protein